ncbi:MAG: hypothetical protein E7406_05280 [Ruminococcaceae bacterium]|nr:hypothetical protein [Oscillospiraceae bacterium]
MRFFTGELWKGINGMSDVYDIETADEIFLKNIQKYNEYFDTEVARVLPKETLELYKKYAGFHDMEIIKLQYEKNEFCIYGKTVNIIFNGVKELRGNLIGIIDTFGYMEILYREATDDFQIGILFSWEDSIYITCSSIVVKEQEQPEDVSLSVAFQTN